MKLDMLQYLLNTGFEMAAASLDNHLRVSQCPLEHVFAADGAALLLRISLLTTPGRHNGYAWLFRCSRSCTADLIGTFARM
jgi:hypothetical protein